jgi:hypothetical protein
MKMRIKIELCLYVCNVTAPRQLMVVHTLSRNSHLFIKPEDSLSYSEESAMGSSPDPYECRPYPYVLFPKEPICTQISQVDLIFLTRMFLISSMWAQHTFQLTFTVIYDEAPHNAVFYILGWEIMFHDHTRWTYFNVIYLNFYNCRYVCLLINGLLFCCFVIGI